MREKYTIIKYYLLNGAFAYSLFGLYALTVAPFVTQFIDYGKPNMFIGVFGFVMLVLEFFAFYFKLKMVKMRSEQKRIEYKKQTGKDIIPSVSPAVFFALCMRMVFRAGVVMVSMTALGYLTTEEKISTQGQIALIISVIVDIVTLGYIYVNTGIYTDAPQNKRELIEDIGDEEKWDKENEKLATDAKYFNWEIVADVILQIYCVMLFTCFWKYINDTGIGMLYDCLKDNKINSDGAFRAFPMMFAMVMIGLMPMRIAYWIEDSLEAYTAEERRGMWITFGIAAIYTCSPTIVRFIYIFILGHYDLHYQPPLTFTGNIIALISFVIVLLLQIYIYGRKKVEMVMK